MSEKRSRIKQINSIHICQICGIGIGQNFFQNDCYPQQQLDDAIRKGTLNKQKIENIVKALSALGMLFDENCNYWNTFLHHLNKLTKPLVPDGEAINVIIDAIKNGDKWKDKFEECLLEKGFSNSLINFFNPKALYNLIQKIRNTLTKTQDITVNDLIKREQLIDQKHYGLITCGIIRLIDCNEMKINNVVFTRYKQVAYANYLLISHLRPPELNLSQHRSLSQQATREKAQEINTFKKPDQNDNPQAVVQQKCDISPNYNDISDWSYFSLSQ